MRLTAFALFAAFHLAGPAQAFDARDRTFAPGRVGAIVIEKTKPADLAKIYGAANVKYQKMGYEGGETPGAFVFSDTPDVLQVMFDEDSKTIYSVIIGGQNWVNRSGLRIGIRIAQLERLNGGAFKFQGFGADEGGRVRADGPALKPFTIYISESDERDRQVLLKHFRVEAEFSSRHPALKSTRFAVSSIVVHPARLQRE